MIEFKERSKGSKWNKRTPRTRIKNHGGDRAAYKEAGWFKHNWKDTGRGQWAFKSIIRFLKANIGRPIDKVFSEFLERCGKSMASYNLKDWFYSYIEEKEKLTWSGGFYITNGILNYKKRTKRPELEYKPSISWEQFNLDKMPGLAEICKKADSTRAKQFMGMFYISDSYSLKPVYLIRRDVYNEELYWLRFKPCRIRGIGDYVQTYNWNNQSKFNKVSYEVGYNFVDIPVALLKYADYIFITKYS